MSVEVQKQINAIMNWGFKIVIALLSYLAINVFKDMKESVNKIGADVNMIKLEMVHVQDQIESNSDNIKRLENATNRSNK